MIQNNKQRQRKYKAMAEKGGGGEEPAMKRSRMEQVGEMILDQTGLIMFDDG